MQICDLFLVLNMMQVVLLALLSAGPAVRCLPVQSQAEQLLSLLDPSPALGEAWPTIPGPELDDRVCIVGAGAAGIHMAVSLKKRNYENVNFKYQIL